MKARQNEILASVLRENDDSQGRLGDAIHLQQSNRVLFRSQQCAQRARASKHDWFYAKIFTIPRDRRRPDKISDGERLV